MSDDNGFEDLFEAASRAEAAAAGESHEVAEAKQGVPPREHVTAAMTIHHHHPADPNAGLVRARPGKHALAAAAVTAAVSIAAVVLLALAIGTS